MSIPAVSRGEKGRKVSEGETTEKTERGREVGVILWFTRALIICPGCVAFRDGKDGINCNGCCSFVGCLESPAECTGCISEENTL